MGNLARSFAAAALVLLAMDGTVLAADPGFLTFEAELARARTAIGPEADCRVLVEQLLARCELRTAGAHAIQLQFADISGNLLPRKSVVLTRGTVEPQRFTGVLAAYGLPTEVVVQCVSGEPARTGAGTVGYQVYVGDYFVTCDRDRVTISYARRF